MSIFVKHLNNQFCCSINIWCVLFRHWLVCIIFLYRATIQVFVLGAEAMGAFLFHFRPINNKIKGNMLQSFRHLMFKELMSPVFKLKVEKLKVKFEISWQSYQTNNYKIGVLEIYRKWYSKYKIHKHCLSRVDSE